LERPAAWRKPQVRGPTQVGIRFNPETGHFLMEKPSGAFTVFWDFQRTDQGPRGDRGNNFSGKTRMKSAKRISSFWVAAALTAIAFTSVAQQNQGNPLPKIREDNSPLPPELKARTSFAPVAKKIAGSVVNVYSSRTVTTRGQSPFFNDPFFRRFFGGEEEEGTPRPRTQQGLGSGVIVSEDGYILTNSHVVQDATDIRIVLASGEEYPARIVGTDPATDIAVLKVDRTGLPAITLADSSLLEVGDTVLAVGNPFGIGQTVTLGIVSGIGRGGFRIVDYEDFIQTDASINPGNSGGALADVLGRLVGINTAILSRTGGNQGVGFAVPVNLARHVLEQLIRFGEVSRGYLGVQIQQLTPELARAFNLKDTRGALVASVSPNSPAVRAGLQEGDIIIEFNGQEVTDSRQLRLMVSQASPESRAEITYLRNGRERQSNVTLARLPDDLTEARGRPGSTTPSGRTGFLEGVEVAELDDQTRRQFNIPREMEGLVVTDVQPGTSAERAGLQAGDVIEEVNRKPVRDLNEGRTALRGQEGSVLLRVWSANGSRYVVVDLASQPETRESPDPDPNPTPRRR
jgi:serine protease Do